MPNSQDKNSSGKILGGKQMKPSVPKVSIPRIRGKSSWRGFIIYAILGLIFFGFFVFTSGSSTRFLPNKPLSQMIADIRDNKVKKRPSLYISQGRKPIFVCRIGSSQG